jgi:hypothetical protein
MATNPKAPATTRIPAGALPNKAPPGAGGAAGQEWTAEDRKLLGYVRTNAQPIVAALTRTSSEAGFRRDWAGMNEFLEIATRISGLCGLAQIAAESPPAMAVR